ncbi:MAG: hypothetical protein IKJ36_07480 [Clostridia bacterium]|nr:hypothetical protein [Clostridia bacterium]
MEKIKDFFVERRKWLFIMFVTIVVILLPTFQKNLVIGDDYEFHLSRIITLAKGLENGEFPVKIHPLFARNHGYASGIFYPNMFMYIPAVLYLIGLNIVQAYNIFLLIMIFFMFVLTYDSIKNITDETNSALIGTILVILSKVMCINLYLRFAVGEFLGLIFLVPIVSGMYDFIYKDFKKPYLLFIGFFGIVNSHIISTIIAIIYCVVYFIIHLRLIKFRNVAKLFAVAILVIMITSSFWMPMIEQLSIQEYKLTDRWVHIESEEYYLYDLLSNQKFSIGLLITILMPMLIYALFDKRISNKSKKFILLLFVIMILTVTPKFWDLTKDVLGIIQFKWRLLGLLTILSSISLTLVIKEYSQILEIKLESVMMSILVLSIFFTLQFNISDFKTSARLRSAEDLDAVYYANTSIGVGQEYLPIEVNYNNIKIENQAKSNIDEEVEVTKRNLHTEFETQKDYDYIVIPSVYYYGYVGNIVDNEGKVESLKIEKADNGLVKVLTEGKEGKVSVWYNGTRIQKVSYIISLFTGFMLIAYLIIKKIKSKNIIEN